MLKTPPLLLGAALLFWGWQTGLLVYAAIVAVVLEGSRLTPARWEFSQADFNRIWDLCTILFVGATIYAFAANEGASTMAGLFDTHSMARRTRALNQGTRSVLLLFEWLPLVFLPGMAAQVFSRRERLDLVTFSWILRRQRAKGIRSHLLEGGINVSWLYFALCLVAASAANTRGHGFYWGLALVLAWGLWAHRSRRFAPLVWGGLLVAVIASGYAAHLGVLRLDQWVTGINAAWLSRFARTNIDPKESRTAIGSIGKVKLSGRIVVRVESPGQPPPTYLREASYNSFRPPIWFTGKREFGYVLPESNQTSWILIPEKTSRRSVRISHYLPNGRGVLALPAGASQLEQLPAFTVETNRLGAVRAEGPGLVSFQANYDEGVMLDSPPDDEDLKIPLAEAAAVQQIAAQLDLAGQAAQSRERALKAVSDFFRKNFEYSTWLDAGLRPNSNRTALAAFLLERRAGHCEYFATATALLLRAAKIPARYAAGYVVQEAAGKGYVVRARHAHAWCLAYVNGAWRDVDTTPASWQDIEAGHASFWEPVADAWSRLWFEFSKWRWGQTAFRKYILWATVPLLAIVAVRLFWKKQWARSRPRDKSRRTAPDYPGTDSEFYQVERRLLELGLERRSGETLSAWIVRITASVPVTAPPLRNILWLHYRHRFDPLGLPAAERAALRAGARTWLEQSERKAEG